MDEPEQTQLASAGGSGTTSFGLRVQNLTPDLAQQLGVDEEHGVVITAVEPGSSADEAGLHRSDMILEVDKQEVKDVDDLEEQLAKRRRRRPAADPPRRLHDLRAAEAAAGLSG